MNSPRAQLLLPLALLLAGACGRPPEPPPAPPTLERVVSLAPSITETVFAIGAGDRLVGNTEWCNYPKAARSVPRVGGYMTLDAERVLAVHPDAILMLAEHGHLRARAAELGIPVVMLDNKTVPDILTTIRHLGRLLDHRQEASRLVAEIEGRMAAVRKRAKDSFRPRVLVTVGRNMGSQGIDSVCCVGRTPFHNELVELAGGTNACELDQPYPRIGPEGLLRMDPDIIIDLMDSHATPEDLEKARTEWLGNGRLKAVQTGRIHVLAGDYTVVPGPRFILLLEQFAGIIHPEAEGGP